VVSVRHATFSAPDGSTFEREIVRHPGAVVVVPVETSEGAARALLVRQYRAAIDGELLELPAGKRDVAGEDPAATAERELVEEVGVRAGRVTKLAEFYNSPGFTDEHSILYLAEDLSPCANDAQGIEEEHMTVVAVDLDRVPELIASGEISDAKTIIGLCLAREALNR